jgi:crotonobetainyl-CoA:carnitine CoA-transferase CaiB-like acyl-CoA transferase
VGREILMDKALAGVKILECGRLVTGPYCTKLLADLGAETVKIEEPGVGDEARKRGPFPEYIPHPERSGLFLFLNTNKLGITLNLKNPKGMEIFSSLVKEADILVEDYSPEEAKALGLVYESLSKLNPKLVTCSITPFGQTGPYRNYKSCSLNTLHAGGQGYLIPGGVEFLDRPPVKVANFFADFCCGLVAAIAILAALYRVNIEGVGEYIDISKQEALMFYERWGVVRYANEKLVVSRATEGYTIGGIMPCKDGFTMFWCVLPHEWEILKKLMGNPAWTEEEKFRNLSSAILHWEEANAYILEWLINYSAVELYHLGQAAGLPFGMVRTAEDLFNSDQMKAREFFVPIQHPAAGTLEYPSAPYKISEAPWGVDHPAPLLGEHNEEIYCQRLGYSKEYLTRLRAAGII